MGKGIQEEISHVDRLVWKIRNEIRLLDRVTPINAEVERATFLQHWENDAPYQPRFEYDTSGVKLDAVDDMITECADIVFSCSPAPHESLILDLYEKTLTALRSAHTVLTHLGSGDIVREEAEVIYGLPPSDEEVQDAERILEQVPERHLPRTRRSSDVHDACREILTTLGLHDWGVTYTDSVVLSASATEKVIKVPNPAQGKTYRNGEPLMAAVHEASHGMRSANGYQQPYNIFGTGINGYQAMDEGLAILLEFAVCPQDDLIFEELQKYALRTLAADTASADSSFWDTFAHLMQYTEDTELAWDITLRAFRGGRGGAAGLVKDHIYQRGLTQVSILLHEHDSPENLLADLYMGKFGMDDLATVQQIRDHGLLESPAYTPSPLFEENAVLTVAEQIAEQNYGTSLYPSPA